ncbi:MAG: hypothetical protein JNL43_08085 [Flavobacteriales bacterium]|nr:hypothetical protein [Flavobacteriales bacterium]
MERERLSQLVEEPMNVGRGDMPDLNALAERYPWFAGAQILRSLGEYKSGDVLSEETLRGTSALVPSRAVLFDLIARTNDLPQPALAVVPKSDPVSAGVPEPVPATVIVVDPVALVETPAPAVPGIVPEVSVPEPVAAIDAPPSAFPEADPVVTGEIEVEIKATPSAPTTALEPDPLERQIMEAAMASAYDFTWLHDLRPPEKHAGAPAPPPEPLPVFPPQDPLVPIAPFEHKRPITRHDKLRFTAWLDATQETTEPEASGVQRTAEIPAAVSDWIRTGPEAEPPAVEGAASRTSGERPAVKPLPKETMGTSDLIDRFINQQPPLAPKAEFYTPQQAAKRSLDDSIGLVTETLARVYEKQGNLPKAIDAYRRLALKYPAKSAYFAALAKELEGQLNK